MTAGYCQCGCGEKTNPAPQTRNGIAKGKPQRFLRGHVHQRNDAEYLEDPDTGCWIWQLGKTAAGYGARWDKNEERVLLAHRRYYEQEHGPIPPGLEIDHLCRNRACVNPEHLEAVTRTVNVRRGLGAKLTLEAVQTIRAARGTKRAADLATEYGIALITVYGLWNDESRWVA